MRLKVILIFGMLVLLASVSLAVDANKPSSHDTSWLKRHGQASKINPEQCKACHTNKTDCIRCHEEVTPRNHTPSWIKRGHGLEARWNRDSCTTCHKEDSCIECHQTTAPSSHRPGWRDPLNRHCNSCHYPVQDTACFTCHKAAHAPGTYE